jgi:hypothetical protein
VRRVRDVFVSYTQDDRGWARWIAWAWQLEAKGYTTVLQAWDVRPATNLVVPDARRAPGSRPRWVILHNAAAERTTTKGEPAVCQKRPGGSHAAGRIATV